MIVQENTYRIILTRERITGIALSTFLFTSPLSVSTLLFGKLDWLILIASVLCAAPIIIVRKLPTSQLLRNFAMLFYVPMLVSTLWAMILMWNRNEETYYTYISSDLIPRLVHIFLFFVLVCEADSLIRLNNDRYNMRILNSFSNGVVFCLGLFGLWQIVGNIFGIWVPEIETRSSLYFARALGINRITSIADEPSYLAPFLIDGIIVLLFLRKPKLIWIPALILLFSLSFGGYMEVICLMFYYFAVTQKKTKLKLILFVAPSIILLLIIFPELIDIIDAFISSRAEIQSGFNMDDTSRTMVMAFPIKKMGEYDLLTILLGNGPASFKYLWKSEPNDCLFSTSNCIYTDLLYEGGVLGLGCFIVLIIRLWRNTKYFTDGNDRVFMRIFLLHLLLSSIYRGDYAGSRYAALFMVFMVIYHIYGNKHDQVGQDNQAKSLITYS